MPPYKVVRPAERGSDDQELVLLDRIDNGTRGVLWILSYIPHVAGHLPDLLLESHDSDAGDVGQHVDSSDPRNRGLDHPLNRCEVSDIGGKGQGKATSPF